MITNTESISFGPAADYRSHRPLRTLGLLLRADAKHLFTAFVFYLIKASPHWTLPIVTANIIDIVSNPARHNATEIAINGLVGLLVVLQNPFTHTIYWNQLSIAIRNMEVRLRTDICSRLQLLSISFLKKVSTGALHTKILRDVESLEQVMRQGAEGMLTAGISISVALVVTAMRAPGFLPIFLLVVPSVVGIRLFLGNKLKVHNREFRHNVEGMSARIINMIEMIPMTRAHAAEEAEIRAVNRKLHNVKDAGLRLDKTHAWFQSLSWTAFTGLNVFCLTLAGWFCYTKALPLTAGDVVLLSSYFAVICNSVMQIANLTPQISRGVESLRSIAEVMESPDIEHNQGRRPVASVRGGIVLERVSFVYPNEAKGSLHEINLSILPGETIGVVGPSGSGKSTLMSIILGFHRPTSGRVFLDGADMNQLDLRTYRKHVSVVSQETLLFPGSIRENLIYGMASVSKEAIYQALKDSNSLEFVETLPDGIETVIGEHGTRLSGGQRQRLAIARALIRQPRVLILDEATSALDAASEMLVQEALDRLMVGRTTFVVAHRLATIRRANRILVLENGSITEMGSHGELLKQKGLYSRLHSLQQLPSAS